MRQKVFASSRIYRFATILSLFFLLFSFVKPTLVLAQGSHSSGSGTLYAESDQDDTLASQQQTMGLGQGMDLGKFGYGVTAQLMNQPITALLNGVTGMHFNWVRQLVQWQEIEPSPGEFEWAALDEVVTALDVRGIGVILVIEGTPDWARPANHDPILDGPPADLALFEHFIVQMAGRYRGLVDVYQIWQGPNDRTHWDVPQELAAGAYLELLQVAYEAIERTSSDVLVLSAGLVPRFDGKTGQTSDLLFLEQLLDGDMLTWCNGVGVQMAGPANPPAEALNENGALGGSLIRLDAIHQMVAAYGGKQLWLTKVGRAVASGDAEVVSEQEQADYLIHAFQVASGIPYVQAIMVDNLNLATAGADEPTARLSLIRSDWGARPALIQLAQMRQAQVLAESGVVFVAPVNRAPQSEGKPR